MDSAPTIGTATDQPTTASSITAAGSALDTKRAATHVLVLTAALVWVSIDLIGDGLLALRSLLASLTSERTATPS